MKIIGITGGVASGKSTVSGYINKVKNYKVIDTDEISRMVIKEPFVTSQIGLMFPGIITDGELDRKKLGTIIFEDEHKREALNKLMHPRINEIVKLEIELHRKNGEKLIFVDSPLLIESGQYHSVNEIWVVECDFSERVHRMVDRNGWTEKKAVNAINSQLHDEERNSYATKIITTTNIDLSDEYMRRLLEDNIDIKVKETEKDLHIYASSSVSIYPGSFDPFTLGHLSIAKHMSKMFKYGYIVFAHNSSKVRATDKTLMMKEVEQLIKDEGMDNIKVINAGHKLVGVVARELGASYEVRGTRDISDDLYEHSRIKTQNEFINPNLQTIMIPAKEYENVSSSTVRELITFGRETQAKSLVPYGIRKLI